MHQETLGYSFGFTGSGADAGNPFYEIKTAFPALLENYALVAGPAFGTAYGIGGILMGFLIDKFKRKHILTTVCVLWSLTSIITGSTNSFFVVCLMRFLLGLCIAGTEPSCYSMLGDYFPQRMRTVANSLLTSGHSIGSGVISLSILLI